MDNILFNDFLFPGLLQCFLSRIITSFVCDPSLIVWIHCMCTECSKFGIPHLFGPGVPYSEPKLHWLNTGHPLHNGISPVLKHVGPQRWRAADFDVGPWIGSEWWQITHQQCACFLEDLSEAKCHLGSSAGSVNLILVERAYITKASRQEHMMISCHHAVLVMED